jgi:hypothetical protein
MCLQINKKVKNRKTTDFGFEQFLSIYKKGIMRKRGTGIRPIIEIYYNQLLIN